MMLSLADDLRTAPTTFRPFRPDPVRPAALRRAAERARLAPWRMLAVTDAQTRLAIRDAHLPHWRAHLADSGGMRILADDRPALVARDLRAADTFAAQLHEAPIHLVVLEKRHAPLPRRALPDLRSALHDEHLDAAPLPLARTAAPELCDLLAIGEELTVAGVLATRSRR
jgi:hypothetical protein